MVENPSFYASIGVCELLRMMDVGVSSTLPPGKGRQAMVVEDDNTMRSLIIQLLRDMEFDKIHHFEGAWDAVKSLERNPVDIVISDWVMPDISGLKFLKALRKSPNPRIAQTRFLILTGHSEEDKVLEAVKAGVDGFMTKPISPNDFYARVVAVLNKEQAVAPENAG